MFLLGVIICMSSNYVSRIQDKHVDAKEVTEQAYQYPALLLVSCQLVFIEMHDEHVDANIVVGHVFKLIWLNMGQAC
jgi:hypothetical protein